MGKEGGGRERKKKTVLAEWLSHMKRGMLRPYAGPGGVGIQATVSKQRGHLRLNPEDFSKRRSQGEQCRYRLSAGKITWPSPRPDSPSGNSTGSSLRLGETLAQGVRREHWHVCFILIFSLRDSVSTFKVVARCLVQIEETFLKWTEKVGAHWPGDLSVHVSCKKKQQS